MWKEVRPQRRQPVCVFWICFFSACFECGIASQRSEAVLARCVAGDVDSSPRRDFALGRLGASPLSDALLSASIFVPMTEQIAPNGVDAVASATASLSRLQ